MLICISLLPKADIREIYHLQPLPHWKIDSLLTGVVMGQELHMRGHLNRMYQYEKPYYPTELEIHMKSNDGGQLHSPFNLLPFQPLHKKSIQLQQVRQS